MGGKRRPRRTKKKEKDMEEPKTAGARADENRLAEGDYDLWRELELSALERTRHVRRCNRCKDLLDQCSTAGAAAYLVEAARLIRAHVAELPDGEPGTPACSHTGCVHHEEPERELGLAVLKLGGEEEPESDIRGVPVGCVPLLVTEKDKPEGFKIGEDSVHRFFKYLKPAAGNVFVRLGPKRTAVHVLVQPAYSSRREDVADAVSIEELLETHGARMAAIRAWVLKKWFDLKALAEMELGLGGDGGE